MNYHWLVELLKEIEDQEFSHFVLLANICWLCDGRVLQGIFCILNSKSKRLPHAPKSKTNKKNDITMEVFISL